MTKETTDVSAPARPFISYAREDQEYVARLCAELGEHDVQVWVDTQHMVPGDRLTPTIEAAVLASEALVPIVTEAYLTSSWCLQEFETAIRHNKQIFPLRVEDVSPERMARFASLIDILWIDATVEDVRTVASRLRIRLRENPARARAHARLVIAAERWEGSGRDAKYLLAGADLEDGLSYVADTTANGPAASVLMRLFIEASERRRREQEAKFQSLYNEAEAERIKAQDRLATSYCEAGRRELFDGEHARATLFLVASLRLKESEECRSLLGVALPPLERRRAVVAQHREYVHALDVGGKSRSVLSAAHDGHLGRAALSGGGMRASRGFDPGTISGAWFCCDELRVAVLLERGAVEILRAADLEPIAAVDLGLETQPRANGAPTEESGPHVSAALSPDHTRLAIVGGPLGHRLFVVCDLERGVTLPPAPGATGTAAQVCWLSDEELVLVVGSAVRVWSVQTHAQVHAFTLPIDRLRRRLSPNPESQPERVALAVHSQARFVAASFTWSKHGRPFVAIWSVTAPGSERVRMCVGPHGFMHHLAFSRDAAWLLSGGLDHAAIVWDVQTGEAITTFLEHRGPICAVAFLDEQLALTGDHRGKAMLWEPDSGRMLATYEGHFEGIRQVRPAPGGFVSAGDDGRVLSWTSDIRDVWSVPGSTQPTAASAFDIGGRLLVASTTDFEVGAWDLQRHEPLKRFRGLGDAPETLAVGRTLVAGGQGGEVTTWAWHDPDEPRVLPRCHRQAIKFAALLFDESHLLTSSLEEVTVVWDLEAGTAAASVPYGGLGVAIHPTRAWVAVADSSGTIHIHELPGLRETLTLAGHRDQILALRFLAAGRKLLSASADEEARIWTLELDRSPSSSAPPCVVLTHSGEVLAADASLDGTYVATAAADNSARIWRTDGALVTSLDDHAFLWDVRLHPRRPLALTVDMKRASALLWHIESGSLLRKFTSPGGSVLSAEFLPDGDTVLVKMSPGVILMPGLERAGMSTSARGGSTLAVWSLAFEHRDAGALAASTHDLPYKLRDGKLVRVTSPRKVKTPA